MSATSTETATEVREIVGHWFDRSFIRRDGVLYEEWFSLNGELRSVCIKESDIPRQAIYDKPIRY